MRPLALAVLLLGLLAAPRPALADYDPAGRRDPFVPAATVAAGNPAWDEVRPTAVVTTPSGGRALLVGGPAGLGLMVRVGDSLGAASVRSLDAERGAVVLAVPDPRTPRGERLVVLTLR